MVSEVFDVGTHQPTEETFVDAQCERVALRVLDDGVDLGDVIYIFVQRLHHAAKVIVFVFLVLVFLDILEIGLEVGISLLDDVLHRFVLQDDLTELLRLVLDLHLVADEALRGVLLRVELFVILIADVRDVVVEVLLLDDLDVTRLMTLVDLRVVLEPRPLLQLQTAHVLQLHVELLHLHDEIILRLAASLAISVDGHDLLEALLAHDFAEHLVVLRASDADEEQHLIGIDGVRFQFADGDELLVLGLEAESTQVLQLLHLASAFMYERLLLLSADRAPEEVHALLSDVLEVHWIKLHYDALQAVFSLAIVDCWDCFFDQVQPPFLLHHDSIVGKMIFAHGRAFLHIEIVSLARKLNPKMFQLFVLRKSIEMFATPHETTFTADYSTTSRHSREP